MKSVLSRRLAVCGVFVLSSVGAFLNSNEFATRAQSGEVAPVIDAAARQALDQSVAAYKSAEFYASDLKVSTRGLPDSPSDGALQIEAKIAWSKPNKINIRGTYASDTLMLISNGSTFWETKASSPQAYLQLKASPTKQILTKALAEIGAENTMFARLMRGEDPLRRFGSSLQTVSLKKVSVKGADGKMQIATDRVAVVVAFARRKDSGAATFILDAKTHLMRSFKITQTQNGEAVTISEIYDGARLTPDGTGFEYSPPPGTYAVNAFPQVNYDPRLRIGAEPFAINARDLDGKAVNLKEYRGQVVLLDFWATWCPPCRTESPEVAAMYERYKGNGLNIVGISLDNDKNSLLQFAQQNNMTWRQVFDGGGWKSTTASLYKVQSIPFTVLVGRDGKIAAVAARGRELERAVATAVAVK